MTKLEAIGLAAVFFLMVVAGTVLMLGWIESWRRAKREWRRRRERRYADAVLKRSRLAHWEQPDQHRGEITDREQTRA